MTKKLLVLATILGLWAEAALSCQARIQPLELLFAPFFKGPSFYRTNSHAAQFAGRTTISSGSASQVVSTNNITSDSLLFATLQVALPAGYITQGRTSLISADVTKTISTTAIYSGAIITVAVDAATTLSSGVERAFRVNSVVDGISFALSTIDSNPSGLTATNLIWALPNAVPQRVKVNTISDGAYFTLGWADGLAKPIDTTVMWEIKKPGSGV